MRRSALTADQLLTTIGTQQFTPLQSTAGYRVDEELSRAKLLRDDHYFKRFLVTKQSKSRHRGGDHCSPSRIEGVMGRGSQRNA